MTTTPTGVDPHAAVCAALTRTAPLLCAVFAQSDGRARPTRMRWTNADIAAHMVASATEAEKAVRGEPSAYDAPPSAGLDEQMVASVPDRDPAVLAHLLEDRTASFLRTVAGRDGDQSLGAPGGSVGVLTALLALDHHLHGGQVAETSGAAWTGEVADLHPALCAVVPYAFDPRAARGFRGSYALHLRGVAPVTYAVDDGRLEVGVPGRPDCVVRSDVPTFLRMGIGTVSQVRAALTGRVRVGGRKPWLAGRTTRLFPPLPHGGVAR
jgi:putative sterol carrier protein